MILTLSFAVIGSVVGVLYQGVMAYIAPKQYESRALLEILPLPTSVFSGRDQIIALTDRDVETQAEIIKSGKVLSLTARSLGLQNRWNMNEEDCIEDLRKNLTVQKNPRSNVIALRFKHANNVDARDITRAIYENYSWFQTTSLKDRAKDELEKISRTLEDQSDALIEKQKAIAYYNIRKSDASSVEQSSPKTIDQLNADYQSQLTTYTKLKTEAEEKKADLERSYEVIKLLEEPTIGNYPVGSNVDEMVASGALHGAWSFATISALCFILFRKEPLAML